jgi:hypothetical protein
VRNNDGGHHSSPEVGSISHQSEDAGSSVYLNSDRKVLFYLRKTIKCVYVTAIFHKEVESHDNGSIGGLEGKMLRHHRRRGRHRPLPG